MFIQFESARVKAAQREAIEKARENILTEAEEKYHRKRAEKEKARLRGDDKWMLPSVEKNLSSEKSKKKRKKEKKEKKSKKKKHKKHSSSSSSDSSNEDEWVEKTTDTKKESPSSSAANKSEKPLQRDEWMSLSGSFFCSSRDKKLQENKAKNQDTCILDKPGQSNKELNPYWKNGGTGLPKQETSLNETNSTTMSAAWLKKSLQRAQEQAQEEGKSLEEIAQERWGSLEIIQSMIEKAEKNCRSSNWSRQTQSNYKYSHRDYKNNYDKSHRNRSRSRSRSRERSRRSYRSKSRSRSQERSRYSYRDDTKNYKSTKLKFKKPDEENNQSISLSAQKSSLSKKNWKKPQLDEKSACTEESINSQVSKSTCERSESSSVSENSEPEDEPPIIAPKILSDDELNKLAAKIVKAEIMGDTELAEKLKEELKNAQEMKKNNPNLNAQAFKRVEENVILTTTSSKGMTKPLEPKSRYNEPQQGRRKNKKINSYEDGQRVRYFADDDKHSLRDMFEKEKGFSIDQNDKAFVKMASKQMDMDELFEERITHEESDAKQDLRNKMHAIKEHKKMEKTLENCHWCIDSRAIQKHLIVAMGSKVYLSLPAHESLTNGHCMIAPIHHCSSQTLIDEDVWEELKIFKKALIKMFTDRNECPVFFEIFMGRHRFPHMHLECVSLPEEVGSMAPMYFKKALLECEMEWSTNKKVVELNKKDIRQAIPKGLPYFAVEFGDQGGFAHVIEDEQLFPRNFAQEIIGGMLDLGSSIWRKPRKQKFEQQKQKVLAFAETWKKYDPSTKACIS
ncbi:CWF19-like protein 2 [Chelonus insularis]|uniref:CWF19-like protein 2 n=1 Tax=Chelonus insularis TaxID=460826 RepID=UPI00158C8B9B|nr:CWF19-like protein 2 [Chelonus insularis]